MGGVSVDRAGGDARIVDLRFAVTSLREVELRRTRLSVKLGESITLRYKARSDAPRMIEMVLIEHTGIQTAKGLAPLKQITLGTDWSTGNLVIVPTESSANAVLSLGLGASTSSIEFEELALEKASRSMPSLREPVRAYNLPEMR
jgi:hypothetical protein